MHCSTLITLLATVQTALANPVDLAGPVVEIAPTTSVAHAGLVALKPRVPDLVPRCDYLNECFVAYDTGSAQCVSGYRRTHLVAKGYPPGSYCERDCTELERRACVAAQCVYYENSCNQEPRYGPEKCHLAMEWCDGPIAMLEYLCTRIAETTLMSTTFNKNSHLCIPEGKAANSRRATPLRLGDGANTNVDLYEPGATSFFGQFSCSGTSYDDSKFLVEVARNMTQGCVTEKNQYEDNTGYDFINIRCTVTKAAAVEAKHEFCQGCFEAQAFNAQGRFGLDLGPRCFYNGIRG